MSLAPSQLALFLVASSAALLMGCPNPNTYGTARTTPKGKVNAFIAPEAWGFAGDIETSANTSTRVAAALPMPPSFGLRLGVSDDIDVGARIANFSSVAADLKVNLVRGDFDLALDPGAQYFSLSTGETDSGSSASVKVVYLYAPLLMDINLSKAFSVVLAPGVTYAYASASADVGGDSDWKQASSVDGIYGRLGLGLDIRLGKKFALHPEITAQRSLGDSSLLQYMMGLGFNFGRLPDFSDVGSEQL